MHKTPAMNESVANSDEEAGRSRGRWILLLLVLFFAVPLLLVVFMQRYDWHPKGNSYGELVIPIRPLQMPPGLLDGHGRPVSGELWRDKWSMVYVSADCQPACLQRLHAMRQLHASLAKDIGRIQRVFISPAAAPGSLQVQYKQLQTQYPDLVIISQPPAQVLGFSRQFDIGSEPSLQANRVYLVDPLGNLMMSFPDSIADADMRKDISRLLRYAWAG